MVAEYSVSFFQQRVLIPLTLAAFFTAAFFGFSQNFKLIVDVGKYPCLGGKLFLLDKNDLAVEQGDLVLIKSRHTLFPDDTPFIKIAVGVAGDEVHVDHNVVSSGNLNYQTDISNIGSEQNMKASEFQQTINIPEGKLFALATLPGAYDSRSWGLVDIKEQLIGTLYVIF